MHPTGTARRGTALRTARLTHGVVRVGVAVVVTLAGTSAIIPAIGAESTTPELQQAGASNGGVASTSSDGDVEIGEIVTGENTGNSIVTGDIAGSAEINGGEIGYPTEINVTLIIEPSIANAEGGDAGEAAVTADDSASDDDNSNGGNGEITIINRNDNRSNAKVVEKGGD